MSLQKSLIKMDQKKLVGLKTRTSFQQESHPETSQIGLLVGRYFQEQTFLKIPSRKNPGITLAAYTEYDTAFQKGINYEGPYTYFIGEEVLSFENISNELTCLEIPAGSYVKFTTRAGPMPMVVIQAWQGIWKMTEEAFGGKRVFCADFEVYDDRAHDPQNTVVDVYVGLEKAF